MTDGYIGAMGHEVTRRVLPRWRRPLIRGALVRGALVRGALELVNAANGVRPVSQQGYLAVPAFVAGWPTTELTPWVLAASMADAARRGIRGDFRGPGGATALALTAGAWGLLGLTHHRNLRSEPHFDAPLREALAQDYESVATRCPSAPRTRVTRLLPSNRLRRRYVDTSATVRYGPAAKENFADIWRRSDLPADGRAPVLLQVPGGAWMIGMRTPQAYPLLSHMAELGWVCVSIDYRVSPKNAWPDHIVDVKRALAWIKENIAEYGGDPDFVAITGGSAGGHLSSLAALTPNDPRFQPGFADADTSVVAAVPIYGRYDWHTVEGRGRRQFVGMLERIVVKKRLGTDADVFRLASPVTHVRADAPPFFVLHGADDSVIPVGEARIFADRLRDASGNTVVYAEIPHAQHAFDFFGSPRGRHTATAVARFLTWVYETRSARTQ